LLQKKPHTECISFEEISKGKAITSLKVATALTRNQQLTHSERSRTKLATRNQSRTELTQEQPETRNQQPLPHELRPRRPHAGADL